MRLRDIVLVICVALSPVVGVADVARWQEAVYKGEDAMLPCIAANPRAEKYVVTWELPGGGIINPPGNERMYIMPNSSLLVTDAREEDFGWYHCLYINLEEVDPKTLYSKVDCYKYITIDY